MRNENEVLNQILDFAKNNEDIRAVVLNGSRVNHNAPKDILQDYDVCMYVTNPELFLKNQSWINLFGELIIMQQNDFISDDNKTSYIFLMLFTDGIRIDMSFNFVEHIKNVYEDSLSIIFLDKDNLIKQLEPPSEKSYYTKIPNSKEFAKVTNEFFWCLTNVAKGLYRDELVYVKSMYEIIVRPCLTQMIEWHIAINNNFEVNSGKFGKWFKKFLTKEHYEILEKTYSGYDYDDIWDSLYLAGKLFRILGIEVSSKLGYIYPIKDDNNVMEYLNTIQNIKW